VDKVRAGVIGISNMGAAHCKNIAAGSVEGMELAAVCDTNSDRFEWASQNLPTPRR
jgi:predicted dehydrogenase